MVVRVVPKHLATAEEAWIAAEKVFADMGIEWAYARSKDKIHMATPDMSLRVRIEDAGVHGWQYAVVYRPSAGELLIWQCSYPPTKALAELLDMLGYGAQSDGDER